SDAVIADGEGHVKELWRHRSEARLVRLHLAGETDAHLRSSVKAAAERNHCRTIGVIARDLDRVLHGLGAGREEDRLLRRRARRNGVQSLGERDVAFVRSQLKTGVREPRQLLRYSGLHLRMNVPGVEYRDATCEVDV